ncbi:MAG TPA: PQQ-dependent sugar dehydrogenase [Xanthomonadaceae bacterium]|nr:PQQ-dependent sugar dehydrogenase [Xanthomonadaceae bacterium]
MIELAEGLEHPWSVALLPDGAFLVTERPGRLRRVSADGALSAPLAGVPKVFARGQGGLLDVVLSPAFATDQRIFISYAEPGPDGTAGTAVASAKLEATGLSDLRVILRQVPKLTGPMHFGSRLVFDRDGLLYVTFGERNDKARAQRRDGLQGKIVRIRADGGIPPGNAGGPGTRPEIFSLGHRNAQSAAFDPRTGRYWTAEHGPRGGDEINLPEAGRNYGWPIASHGIDYSGSRPYPETIGTSAPGMTPPYHVWPISPGLSGMAFYTGRPGSAWNDSLFLGALAQKNLIRLSLDGDRINGEERLLEDRGERIRDVRVGADSAVYVLTDEGNGKLLKLTPPK